MMSILRRIGSPAFAVILAVLALSPFTLLLQSQEGPTVNQSDGPPGRAYTKRLFYDGSDRLEYVCHAESNGRRWEFTITAATNATPIVVTLPEAHGLYPGALVTITQAQGNTAANGVWQVTTPSSTTLGLLNRTTAANSVGNGTYAANTGLLVTYAPRMNQPQWSIQKLIYGASGLEFAGWIEGSSNVTGGKICDNRASYGVQ